MKHLLLAGLCAGLLCGCKNAEIAGQMCYTDPETGQQLCVGKPIPPPPVVPVVPVAPVMAPPPVLAVAQQTEK